MNMKGGAALERLVEMIGQAVAGNHSDACKEACLMIDALSHEDFHRLLGCTVHGVRFFTGLGGWWMGVGRDAVLHRDRGSITHAEMRDFTSDKHLALERVWWPGFEYVPRCLNWGSFDLISAQIQRRVNRQQKPLEASAGTASA